MSVIYGILNVLLVYSIVQSLVHVAVYKRIVRFSNKGLTIGFVWKHGLRRSYLVSKVISVVGVSLCLCILYVILFDADMSIPKVTGALTMLNYAGLLLSNFACPKFD